MKNVSFYPPQVTFKRMLLAFVWLLSFGFSANAQTNVTTGYYYIVNKDTSRNPYLYNNSFATSNTNKFSLLSATKVETNNGIWHVTVNDDKSLSVVNGDGNPVVAGASGGKTIAGTFSTLTPDSIVDDGTNRYYLFKERIDATNANTVWRLDGTTNTEKFITTWANGNKSNNDVLWRFDPVSTEEKTVYNVEISGIDGGYVAYTHDGTTENAYNGGFFIASSEISSSDLAVYQNGTAVTDATVTIENGVIKVEDKWGGKTVTFTNVQQSGTEYVLYVDDSNTLQFSTKSASTLGASAQFLSKRISDGVYSFYNEKSSQYMIWRGNTSGGYNDNSGTLSTYNSTYCDFTVVDASTTKANTYYLVSKRQNGTTDGSFVIMAAGRFDAYGNSVGYTSTYSNLFKIDVVETTSYNTYTASATVTYDGGTATSLSDQKVDVSTDGTEIIYHDFTIGSDVIGDLTITGVTATTTDGVTTYTLENGSATLSNVNTANDDTYGVTEGGTVAVSVTGTYDATNSFQAKFTAKVNSKEAVVLYNGYVVPTTVEYSTDYVQVQSAYTYSGSTTYTVTNQKGQKVSITQTGNDSYTFVYRDFYINGTTELGDVTVKKVTGTTAEDGTVTYSFTGKATITNSANTSTVAEGGTLPITITATSKDTDLQAKFTVTVNDGDYGKTVGIVRFNYCESITLNEGSDNSAVLTDEYKSLRVNAKVSRTMTQSKWNTFCLPFTVSESEFKNLSQHAKIKAFKSVEGTTMYLEDATSIEARKPYLVMPTDAYFAMYVTSYTKATMGSSTTPSTSVGSDDYKFIGVYSPKTFSESEAAKSLILVSDGKLVNPVKETTMKGLRAYFTYTGKSEVAPRLVIDGVETALTEVVSNEEVSDGRIYNMRGMYVGNDASRLAKGIYIMNGKKVVLK